MDNVVIILDFGSQYTQLIARRIREMKVYCEIIPYSRSLRESKIEESTVKGVILSGGPASVDEEGAPRCDEAWLNLGVPVLGVCYGMQLLALLSGGLVEKATTREYGDARISIDEAHPLFEGYGSSSELTQVWMSHGDHVDVLPEGFKGIASSTSLPIAAFADEKRRWYGLQFHPEVAHSPDGEKILHNFVVALCNAPTTWTASHFIEESVSSLKNVVPPHAHVVCGLSGGVDSTVAATLVHRAIGERLHCIFVDNGLLRYQEAQFVEAKLGAQGLGLPLTVVDASHEFLAALRDVTDPEQKRKIIGKVFIDVFEREAEKIGNVTHLVQGTLYPDVIESVSVNGPSATIKTHHNVGGLPEKMNLALLEPLRELFKDEVRTFGEDLGVPSSLLWRQPFPGPGLAVRILGEVTEEKLSVLRKADYILAEEIESANLGRSLWQSFCVLLPIHTVGVMGDGRTYQRTIGLRLVTSSDGMTATWAYPPEEFLRRVSSRITNEVIGINRVVLDISNKPPSTIEWE
jgi:GMP synthase (glutamine-hydrolysing)